MAIASPCRADQTRFLEIVTGGCGQHTAAVEIRGLYQGPRSHTIWAWTSVVRSAKGPPALCGPQQPPKQTAEARSTRNHAQADEPQGASDGRLQ